MELLKDISEQIILDFKDKSSEAKLIIISACEKHDYLSTPRIIRCILFLSKGSLDELVQNIEVAKNDPRDVMLYAEYENEGQDENPKRIRNFNKVFTKAQIIEKSKEFLSEDFFDSNSILKRICIIVIVLTAFYFISSFLRPNKPNPILFSFFIGIVWILIYFFEKRKQKIIFDYEEQELVYSYCKYISKEITTKIDFSAIKSEIKKIPTRSGAKIELTIYSEELKTTIINERDHNFDKNKLNEIHLKIQQINQDYC